MKGNISSFPVYFATDQIFVRFFGWFWRIESRTIYLFISKLSKLSKTHTFGGGPNIFFCTWFDEIHRFSHDRRRRPGHLLLHLIWRNSSFLTRSAAISFSTWFDEIHRFSHERRRRSPLALDLTKLIVSHSIGSGLDIFFCTWRNSPGFSCEFVSNS